MNLMYFRYEKLKKWITRPPSGLPAGKSGVVLKIKQGGSDNPQKRLPHRRRRGA